MPPVYAPQVEKSWTPTPNQRRPYTTLIDQAGYFAYRAKTLALAAGWSIVCTSTGLVGPADLSDNTDRIAAVTDFATRGASAATPQSWLMLRNVDGVQMLIAFQGATDDVLRISYSPGGLFALAATKTHQPTASDEFVCNTASTVVGTSTTAERINHFWFSNDSRHFRWVTSYSGAIQRVGNIDFTVAIAPSTTFPVPYVGGYFETAHRSTSLNITTPTMLRYQYENGANCAYNTASWRGFGGRVFTAAANRMARMVAMSGVCMEWGNGNSTVDVLRSALLADANAPSLGGTSRLVFPMVLWGSGQEASVGGPWGCLIDWYQVITNSGTSPATATMMPGYSPSDVPNVSGGQSGVGDPRTNWWVVIGTAALWPWQNVSASMDLI